MSYVKIIPHWNFSIQFYRNSSKCVISQIRKGSTYYRCTNQLFWYKLFSALQFLTTNRFFCSVHDEQQFKSALLPAQLDSHYI